MRLLCAVSWAVISTRLPRHVRSPNPLPVPTRRVWLDTSSSAGALSDAAAGHGAMIRTQTEVTSIARLPTTPGSEGATARYRVHTKDGRRFDCHSLIIAAGPPAILHPLCALHTLHARPDACGPCLRRCVVPAAWSRPRYASRIMIIAGVWARLRFLRGLNDNLAGIDIPVTPVKGQIWSTPEAPAGTLRKVIYAYEKAATLASIPGRMRDDEHGIPSDVTHDHALVRRVRLWPRLPPGTHARCGCCASFGTSMARMPRR